MLPDRPDRARARAPRDGPVHRVRRRTARVQYAPPHDLDELDAYLAQPPREGDVLTEVRAYIAETATLHSACADATVVAGIPVLSFPGGVVLAACERTYELRADLRAAGGVWRVVNTSSGKVLGWTFPSLTNELVAMIS
ncbi:MAG: hypothetical protein EB084_25845 [Proteobacteria bacterium]|nr:hypothetical protein [Pseudomonadota bacterium]